jgi:hypothetical protein
MEKQIHIENEIEMLIEDEVEILIEKNIKQNEIYLRQDMVIL